MELGNDVGDEFKQKIKKVMETMRYNKTSPSSCFIERMKSMLSIRVNWSLIYACIPYWDEKRHVFRFGEEEMCPLVEEIEKMLGLDYTGTLIVPSAIRDREGELAKVLGVPTNFYGAYVHDFMILLENVLLGFEPLYRSDRMICKIKYEDARENACLLMILGILILREDIGMCSLRCLTLVNPIRSGGRLGPLVLGETILGLDACVKGRSFLKGCPLLVYMWLCEKFKLVKPPRVPYKPKHFLGRGKAKKFLATESSGAWQLVFDIREVEWLSTHLDLSEIVISTGTYRGVALPTLNYITFYLPWRVLRQVGHRQEIVQLPSRECYTRPLVGPDIQGIHSIWHGKKTISVLPTLIDKKMDPFYYAWLINDLTFDDRSELKSAKRHRRHSDDTSPSGSGSGASRFT